MARRRLAGKLGILAGLVAATSLTGASVNAAPAAASAKPTGKPRVVIAAPRDRARIDSGRMVVRLRVRGTRLRAYLNHRNVTSRFRRGRGGLRTAVLRRGRDYRPGDVALFVRVGRGRQADTDLRYYYATRRRDGAASLKVSRGAGAHPVPVLRLRTKRPLRDWKVRLNGRRVGREFSLDDGARGLRGRLGAHSGVGFGLNRVVFEVVQQGGTIARKVASFRIRRGQPVASAGRDRRVGVGRPALLDGRASRPIRHGKQLRYRWTAVQAPSGSKATIPSATSARSRFVPDVPGTYLLRLAVSHPGGPTSADEVRVDAPQTSAPMGIPIQTRTSGGGIQIGSEYLRPAGDWVQMVVLDAGQATPKAGPWGPASQGFGIDKSAGLVDAVRQTGSGELVILSGRCCSGTIEAQPAQDLQTAIEYLGGTVQSWGTTPGGASDLWTDVRNEWSLIGHAGLPRAAADQNFSYTQAGIPGFLGGGPGGKGSLNGYLQSVTTLAYEYVSPENVSLDTKWTPSVDTPPSPTRNVIKVGDQSYSSGTINQGDIAIQLLVLDPSDLHPIRNETFGVINADRSTNFGGIYYLDQALHDLNVNHTVGYSPVIVLQDFGEHDQPDWPGGNSTDWVQDTLPGTADSRWWSGNRLSNGTADLFHSWNQANVHGFGSVAGNLGELVGPAFHDVVANYRRPFFDPDHVDPNGGRGAVVARTSGGLTVVAEPNLYQWSSAFGQGQTDASLSGTSETRANGRIVGTLSRNEQAQWHLRSPANGPGFTLSESGLSPDQNLLDPGALWELVFQPAVDWPCSVQHPAPCPPFPSQIAAANRYFARTLFDSSVFDVREMYTQGEAWGTLADTLNRGIPYVAGRGFGRGVYRALRTQLSTEFDDLDELATGVSQWQNVIARVGQSAATIDIQNAAAKVTAAVQDVQPNLLGQETQINATLTTSDSLLIGSSIIDLGLSIGLGPEALAFAPPALGGIAAVFALGDDLFGESTSHETTPAETQQLVDDDTAAIRDTVGNLSLDLSARYAAINDTMGHFQDVFATDWGKLQEAAANYRTIWALNSTNRKLVGRSLIVGAERQLYNAALPIAFSQWIISPQETDINGDAALALPHTDYICRGDSSDTGGTTYVYGNGPASGTTSVQYTGSPGPGLMPYTVRFLKQSTDNLRTDTTSDFNGLGTPDTLVPHAGTDPPGSLLDPLFEPTGVTDKPNEPTNLGMSKDAFFGQPMAIQQLQCGAVPGQ